jgi:hypothetical protein
MTWTSQKGLQGVKVHPGNCGRHFVSAEKRSTVPGEEVGDLLRMRAGFFGGMVRNHGRLPLRRNPRLLRHWKKQRRLFRIQT